MARPLLFQTPELLQAAIDEYFESESKPTLAGLAYHMGIDRQTLYNYEQRDLFFDIVKRARERVEAHYEKTLIYSNSATGVIFALKNMGWKDKTEVDSNVNMGVTFNETKTYDLVRKADDSTRPAGG